MTHRVNIGFYTLSVQVPSNNISKLGPFEIRFGMIPSPQRAYYQYSLISESGYFILAVRTRASKVFAPERRKWRRQRSLK